MADTISNAIASTHTIRVTATLAERARAALAALDADYTAFNARRSLRPIEAEFERLACGPLTLLRDPTRPSGDDYNRILGLGPATLAHLPAALDAFHALGLSPRIDVVIEDADARVCDALATRGFRPAMGPTWLAALPALAPATSAPANPDLAVRRLGPSDRERLFDFLADPELGGPIAPEVRARRAEHYATERFRVYFAELGGVPVGVATLYVVGDVGVLANAFTLATARGRGVQAALIAARLSDAADLGLTWVATDVAGGGASHRNVERAGFHIATAHLSWAQRAVVD